MINGINKIKSGAKVFDVTDNSNHKEVIFLLWENGRAVVLPILEGDEYTISKRMMSLTTESIT